MKDDKSELLKKLHASPRFQAALAAARTPEERAGLLRAGEQFVGSFGSILDAALAKAQNDPLFREQLGRAIVERQSVVTTSDPAKSGSAG